MRRAAALAGLAALALAGCDRRSNFDPERFAAFYRAATPEERREALRPICLFRRSGVDEAGEPARARREMEDCLDRQVAIRDARYL